MGAGTPPTRDRGHGRAETRTLKAAHVSDLDFPHARQAIKITRWRKDIATGRASRQTVYAVTSMTSADATARDLARLARDREAYLTLAGGHRRASRLHSRRSAARSRATPRRTGTIPLAYRDEPSSSERQSARPVPAG